MAKGFFTQGVCLLTDGETTIDDVKLALEAKDFEIVKEAPPQKDWRFGGPTLVVAYLPEDNGNVAHYLLGLDRALQTGEEIDGPGDAARAPSCGCDRPSPACMCTTNHRSRSSDCCHRSRS